MIVLVLEYVLSWSAFNFFEFLPKRIIISDLGSRCNGQRSGISATAWDQASPSAGTSIDVATGHRVLFVFSCDTAFLLSGIAHA